MEFNLGDEVEYTLAKKGAKLSAENIKKLPKGTVSPEVRNEIGFYTCFFILLDVLFKQFLF